MDPAAVGNGPAAPASQRSSEPLCHRRPEDVLVVLEDVLVVVEEGGLLQIFGAGRVDFATSAADLAQTTLTD